MRKLNPEYVEAVKPLVNSSPYFGLLSMSIRHIEIGHAVLNIDLQKKHLQPFGAVHGGVFASIVDTAAFWAVFSEVDEDAGMTTVDLTVNYLSAAQTGKLVARGTRIKLCETVGLGKAEVTNEKGEMLAHGTSTLMILSSPRVKLKRLLPPKFIDGE